MENEEKKLYTWRCRVCGYEFQSELEELPEDYLCPVCGAPRSAFDRVDD